MHAAPSRRSARSASAPALPRQSANPAREPGAQTGTETKARVTQLDIARAAGVHNTTVSLALRNNPSIPAETRRRIQDLAEKLGYCPDPALRALVAYRNGLATNRRVETIAYITHGATRWGWRENPAEEHYFLSAQRRAEACGYHLEHFWLGEPGLTDRRLSSVLFHRGITGALLAAHTAPRSTPLDLEWERLTVVAVGPTPCAPALHRATNDAAGNTRLAIRQIRRAGYARVGMVVPKAWDDLVDQAWSVGFIAAQNEIPPAQRIPIFFQQRPDFAALDVESHGRESAETARLARWLHEFQPDALLGPSTLLAAPLARLGVEIGRDIGFVELLHDGTHTGMAGVRQNCERVGEIAVEILIGQLQQHLRGLPSIPTTTLVGGVWTDGASLPSCPVSSWDADAASVDDDTLKRAETAA